MKLSKRLQTIANFIKEDKIVADIGTDHAYIPIYLTEQGIIKKSFALDINKGPLNKARENITACGFERQIEVRLSDGLSNLMPYEADTVLIAGMGGELIMDILSRGRDFFSEDYTFVLSPHTKLSLVREFLCDNRFVITREDMCIDEGKYYTVMEAVFENRQVNYKKRELMFGRYLIENNHPILTDFLIKERKKYETIISENKINGLRKVELSERLNIIKETLDEMQ